MGTIRSKIFKGISGNIHIKVILKYKMLNLDNIVSNKKKIKIRQGRRQNRVLQNVMIGHLKC